MACWKTMTWSSIRAAILLTGLFSSACGVSSVAGHYQGSVSGSLTVLSIPFPVLGDIQFQLEAAGDDLYRAVGDLIVQRQSDGKVTYQATLEGEYALGDLNLSFTSLDKKSSGTMRADLSGSCWDNGTWTLSGTGTSGAGSWSACR